MAVAVKDVSDSTLYKKTPVFIAHIGPGVKEPSHKPTTMFGVIAIKVARVAAGSFAGIRRVVVTDVGAPTAGERATIDPTDIAQRT